MLTIMRHNNGRYGVMKDVTIVIIDRRARGECACAEAYNASVGHCRPSCILLSHSVQISRNTEAREKFKKKKKTGDPSTCLRPSQTRATRPKYVAWFQMGRYELANDATPLSGATRRVPKIGSDLFFSCRRATSLQLSVGQ